MVKSADGGETRSRPRTIGKTRLDDRDPGVVALPDGRLLAAYGRRTTDRGGFGVYASLSSDGGRSWGSEARLSGATNNDPGYPASVELDDGTILTVYYQQPPEGGKPCIMATKWRLQPAESPALPNPPFNP